MFLTHFSFMLHSIRKIFHYLFSLFYTLQEQNTALAVIKSAYLKND